MSIADLLLFLTANLAWAFNFIAGKIGAEHFQPLLFTCLRFIFLLILTLPWLRPVKGSMVPLLRVAFLLGTVHFSMMFIGLNAGGNIASIAVTSQLYIPMSAILAAAFLKEKITPVGICAILIAFVGVFIVGFDPIVFNHIDALLWVTGASLVMATATILMRQCPNLGVLRLQAWIALVAIPSLLLLSFIFEEGQIDILKNSDPLDFWTPLYSATGASIVGHGIVYLMLGKHPVSRVTPLLLPAPVLASFFGIFLLHDILGWRLILGGFLTLLGTFTVVVYPELSRRKRKLH